MSIFLGNIQFSQVRDMLGYELNEDDKKTWHKFHSQSADLRDKESCFHVFDMPRCIQFKGVPARDAIMKMFTPEKLVEPMGTFEVLAAK